MRTLTTLAAIFATVTSPAFAHPAHGYQLPDFFHAITEADHLAILTIAIVLMTIIGRFAFKKTRK